MTQAATLASGPIINRPNRPIVVKCGYENTVRRVTFPTASTCRLSSLRSRIEECFHLSAAPFYLAYVDDDGEEYSIRSEAEFTEAIAYFVSGDDDGSISTHSGNSRIVSSTQKITIRLEVVVEYDGPSLSDTSSLFSSRTSLYEQESEASWQSETNSHVSQARTEGRYSTNGTVDDQRPESQLSGSTQRLSLSDQSTAIPPTREVPPSAESGIDPSLSLLTQSDLGNRWLKEQSRLTHHRHGVKSRSSGTQRNYDSDEETINSDEENLGDIALERDARGSELKVVEVGQLTRYRILLLLSNI
jgi:hypothetical protein